MADKPLKDYFKRDFRSFIDESVSPPIAGYRYGSTSREPDINSSAHLKLNDPAYIYTPLYPSILVVKNLTGGAAVKDYWEAASDNTQAPIGKLSGILMSQSGSNNDLLEAAKYDTPTRNVMISGYCWVVCALGTASPSAAVGVRTSSLGATDVYGQFEVYTGATGQTELTNAKFITGMDDNGVVALYIS